MTTPVVLVVGAPLAGVGGVVAALREQLPRVEVVEAGVVEAGVVEAGRDVAIADVVVAVVSAVAPVAASDWDLVENAAESGGSVLAVVSKIDAHVGWRAVLAADRELVAGWAPHRSTTPWVGVAAAPDIGDPDIGELVTVLSERLAEPRNHLSPRRPRASAPRRRPSAVATHPPPVADAAQARAEIQRIRLRLLRIVRSRCTSLRTEFRDAAAALPMGASGRFETLVRSGASLFLAELDGEIARAVGGAADQLGVAEVTSPLSAPEPPELPRTPSTVRRLETRLMAVLGAGFGLGVALAAGRLLAGLAPGLSVLAVVAGGAVGLALATWVVRVRGLLQHRAVLERWATDLTAALRWHGETVVAERLLGVESAWAAGRLRRPAAHTDSSSVRTPSGSPKKLLTSTNGDSRAFAPETPF